MKAWLVHEWCKPDGMKFEDISVPKPAATQVLIRNRAAGLNFFDLLMIQGLYQSRPGFPFSPGAEVAGTVEAIGSDVSGFKVGDRVLAFAADGGYRELTLAEAEGTFAIPDGMSFSEAAGLPIVYHTSYFAIENRAQLKAGEWLLVHAGASGVGMSAIQIGKAYGARVIATAGSPEKLEFCTKIGAEHAIDYRDEKWVEQVNAITRKGADVIYDPVGGDVFDLSTKCIAPGGRLLVIGFASGRIPSIQANRALLKQISIVGVFWGRHRQETPGYTQSVHQALVKLFQEGKLRPIVGQEFPLSEAPKAMGALATRKIAGKAVLTMG